MPAQNHTLIMDKSFKYPLNYSFNSPNLPLPNIISNHNHAADIELKMIGLQSKNYTSLKDLLPVSPPSTVSPTSSWREIPIKDPLVQHAAWAYLMPMESTHGDGDSRWRRFIEKCGGWFCCVNGVVSAVFKDWFPEQQGIDDDDDEGFSRRKIKRRKSDDTLLQTIRTKST